MTEPPTKAEIAAQDGGVLAALPRTRPQRQSKRRQSARARNAKRTPAADPGEPPVPPQGFEPESDASDPVSAPSAAELLVSLGGVAGELVQSGLSAGGRLLRDALSRL